MKRTFCLLMMATIAASFGPVYGQLDNNDSRPSCSCLFTDECGSGEYCDGDCTDRSDPLDPKAGLCAKHTNVGGPETAAQALDSILLAYETAGVNGGGPVNPSVLQELSRLGLSKEQQQSIHHLAVVLMGMYIGSADANVPFRRGYLIPPFATENFKGVTLGSTVPFQAYLAKAAPRIRQAIVAELREPNQGHLERIIEQIASTYPRLLTFGRCDYPFPLVDFSFPHRDGLACLMAEMKDIIGKVYQSELKSEQKSYDSNR